MAAHYARTAYLQAQVQPETDPKRLILMLYEGALKHIRLAREGIEDNNARQRGEHLSRAVAIVSALHSSLDSDVVDEPVAFVRGLYQAIMVELSQVAVTHDVNVLDLAFRYVERLKQIWEHDVMGLPFHGPAEQQDMQRAATPTTAPPVVVQRPVYSASPLVGRRTVAV
jgi:flagellar protein FliS